MTDKTHLVDDLSLLVTSLKQQTLMKVIEALIRPDLEANPNTSSFYSNSLERLSDKTERLHIPNRLKSDIRDAVLFLYRNIQHFSSATSLPLSALKFNVCGDLDVDRSFNGHMNDIIRGSGSSGEFKFFSDACNFHQDRCIRLTLCKLLSFWIIVTDVISSSSDLDSSTDQQDTDPSVYVRSLYDAKREVNVRRENNIDWYYDIRFVIEDVDDPSKWIFVANMCNTLSEMTEVSFEGNTLSVTTRAKTSFLLWSKMTALQKSEHAEENFKAALKQSDTHFLIQTMRYVESSRKMNLIKRNLMSFILCFLVHPYYRRLIPDLQLVEEDLQLVRKEDFKGVFKKMLDSLRMTRDYSNISDSLIQLQDYVSSRNNSLGKYVFDNIWTLFCPNVYGRNFKKNAKEYDDAKECILKLHAAFCAKR